MDYRFQQIIHTILACRMLLNLHDFGQHTVRGDEFKDFTVNANTMVFVVAHTPESNSEGSNATNDLESGGCTREYEY